MLFKKQTMIYYNFVDNIKRCQTKNKNQPTISKVPVNFVYMVLSVERRLVFCKSFFTKRIYHITEKFNWFAIFETKLTFADFS